MLQLHKWSLSQQNFQILLPGGRQWQCRSAQRLTKQCASIRPHGFHSERFNWIVNFIQLLGKRTMNERDWNRVVEQLLKQSLCFNKVKKVSWMFFRLPFLQERVVVLHTTTLAGKKSATLIYQASAYLRCCLDTNWQKLSLTNIILFLFLLLNSVATVCFHVAANKIPWFYLSNFA